jgi:hypothetical protein
LVPFPTKIDKIIKLREPKTGQIYKINLATDSLLISRLGLNSLERASLMCQTRPKVFQDRSKRDKEEKSAGLDVFKSEV